MAKSKKAETKAEVVADLSAQLSDMLNPPKAGNAGASTDENVPTKKAASRSNYKGTMVVPNPAGGVLSVFPVKTYVATDADKFERHMYHGTKLIVDADGKPVLNGDGKQKTETCYGQLKQDSMTCSCCGDKVAKSASSKGVEAGDKVVFISDDEMKAQQPMSDKTMKILEYTDESEINPIYYEDAEFVVADKGGETAFAMLAGGLARTGKVAKGVRVKGGREQYFILRPYGQHGMSMHYLRADYEVRSCNLWAAANVDPKLVDAMAQLIEAVAVPFTPAPQDAYFANVRKMAASKLAGTAVSKPTVEAEPKTTGTDDLLAKLQASVASANKAKSATAGK